MSRPKVLIAHRPGPEIEAMLEDANCCSTIRT